MGCKLSMPLRTLRRIPDRHEKLEEDDERYFLKVQARNKSSYYRERISDGRDSEAVDATENESTFFGEDAELGSGDADGRFETQPFEVDTTLSSHHILYVQTEPPPRFAMPAALPGKGVASKRRLERQRTLFEIASTSPLEPHSFDSWSSTGESQFDTASEVSSDVFDALLPSGMIWNVIKRTGKVTAVAMSNSKANDSCEPQHADTLLLAVGTDDGKVCVVEVRDERGMTIGNLRPASPEPPRNLGTSHEVARNGKIRSLDFSSDGSLIAIGGDDGMVAIYRTLFQKDELDNYIDMTGLDLVGELERVDRVYAARFSPNGDLLAVGGFDSIVTIAAVLWVDEELVLDIITEVHRPGLVLCLDWIPNGEMLAVGGTDKCATILDKSWKVVGEIPQLASVESLKWNPDGSLLAVVCGDTVTVVNAGSYEVVGEIEIHDRTHNMSKGISDDLDGSLSTMSPRRSLRVFSVCWSPDGSFLAVGGSDGCCELIESRGFTRVHEVRRLKAITSLAWGEKQLESGDCARYLAIGGEDSCVAILKAGIDVEASSCLEEVSSTASSSLVSAGSRQQPEWVFKEDSFGDVDEKQQGMIESNADNIESQKVTCVAFSKGSKSKPSLYFAFATDGCFVSIATTKTWDSIARLEFVKPIRSIQFANKSNLLVLGGDDAMVYVVSVSTQQLIVEKLLSAPICSLGFSWGDERLAVASVDGLLALLDPKDDFELVGEMDSSDATILALDWSSKNLGIGRSDGSIAVHDTDKVFGNFFVPQVELHKRKAIRSLAFGVSGRFLAVGGDDGKLSVYSEKGDWVLCHQVRIDSTVKSVNWSPTGRYLGYCAVSITQICKVIDTVLWVEVSEVQLALRQHDSSADMESTCLSWNADGSSLAIGTTKNGILVVDAGLWKFVVALRTKLTSL